VDLTPSFFFEMQFSPTPLINDNLLRAMDLASDWDGGCCKIPIALKTLAEERTDGASLR
jgi:hypothetical protein